MKKNIDIRTQITLPDNLMLYNCNQQDIELLISNPYQIILINQDVIDNVVHQYIRSGTFKLKDLKEIKQQVNAELLNRVPKIQDQFQGKSLFRTYLTVIVRNICNELIRKEIKIKHISFDEIIVNEKMGELNNEAITALIFEEEIFRLRKAIDLYYKQKFKIILCLKLKFKIPFDFIDFKSVYENITYSDFNNFVQQVLPYQKNPDVIIFGALTEIFNKYGNKNNTPDALRKWVKLKTSELIDILNGNPPKAWYTEETFQILFEKCFSDKELISKIY